MEQSHLMPAHAYTDDQLVEQPAIQVFAELGLLLSRLLSGQVTILNSE
jgi:predicted nucleotide-binding protein